MAIEAGIAARTVARAQMRLWGSGFGVRGSGPLLWIQGSTLPIPRSKLHAQSSRTPNPEHGTQNLKLETGNWKLETGSLFFAKRYAAEVPHRQEDAEREDQHQDAKRHDQDRLDL
jgi:hypothetical protein